MGNVKNILESLNPVYFWDVDVSKLDPVASRRLIIERIYSRGTLEEMQQVMAWYGRQETIEVLKGLHYLDPKTLGFVSKVYNIPITDFTCYKRRQLNRQHWNF